MSDCRKSDYRAELEKFIIHKQANHKPFAEFMYAELEKRNLTKSGAFEDATLLNRNILSKLRNNTDGHFDKRTIITLCVACNFDLDKTVDALRLAGHALSPSSKADLAYAYVIDYHPELDIHDKNEILNSVGVKTLGSLWYNKTRCE